MKSLASKFGATGSACLQSAIALKRRLWRARMPFSRSSRYAFIAGQKSPVVHHERRSVGTFQFGTDGLDQRPHLHVCQPHLDGFITSTEKFLLNMFAFNKSPTCSARP